MSSAQCGDGVVDLMLLENPSPSRVREVLVRRFNFLWGPRGSATPSRSARVSLRRAAPLPIRSAPGDDGWVAVSLQHHAQCSCLPARPSQS